MREAAYCMGWAHSDAGAKARVAREDSRPKGAGPVFEESINCPSLEPNTRQQQKRQVLHILPLMNSIPRGSLCTLVPVMNQKRLRETNKKSDRTFSDYCWLWAVSLTLRLQA